MPAVEAVEVESKIGKKEKMAPSKETGAGKASKKGGAEKDGGGKHELSILKDKESEFAEWYPEVIKKAELIEYYDISGCYILRPGAFFMWEQIQGFVDKAIKKMGVKNAYFPLFVSKGALETEKDHVEGFAPEVAWVTKAGESEL